MRPAARHWFLAAASLQNVLVMGCLVATHPRAHVTNTLSGDKKLPKANVLSEVGHQPEPNRLLSIQRMLQKAAYQQVDVGGANREVWNMMKNVEGSSAAKSRAEELV